MADIFNRDVAYGGAFSADGASVTFTNDSSGNPGFAAGLLIQQMSWQYQQAIQRLYEVAGPNVYLVAGRTQGQCSLSRVIGPAVLAVDFYTNYGDVCNAASNSLTFTLKTGCGDITGNGSIPNTTRTIVLNNCVIAQLQGAVQAQDMIISEMLAIIFIYMSLS